MILLLFVTLLFADNPHLMMADRLLQRQLFIHALRSVEEVIADGHGDDEVYAARGNILAIRGRYYEAIDDFEYAVGADRLWKREGEGYADSLSATGRCQEAAELREGIRLVGDLPGGASLRMFSDQVHDFRNCGLVEEAWKTQMDMEAKFPRAVLSYFAAAELYLDQGDIEQAYRELWSSQLYFQHAGWRDILARIALQEKRYEEAFQLMKYIQAQRVPDRTMIRYMLSALLANDPAAVYHKTEQLRWSSNENPIIRYLRIEALQELGRTAELEAEKSWFAATCSSDCQNWVKGYLRQELSTDF